MKFIVVSILGIVSKIYLHKNFINNISKAAFLVRVHKVLEKYWNLNYI